MPFLDPSPVQGTPIGSGNVRKPRGSSTLALPCYNQFALLQPNLVEVQGSSVLGVAVATKRPQAVGVALVPSHHIWIEKLWRPFEAGGEGWG